MGQISGACVRASSSEQIQLFSWPARVTNSSLSPLNLYTSTTLLPTTPTLALPTSITPLPSRCRALLNDRDMAPTYPLLANLKVKSVPGLVLKYSPFKTPRTVQLRKLLDRFCPDQDAVLDKYSKIPSDTLQWNFITEVAGKALPKAVLRNRVKRRWASAFADALRKNGYHANGRSIRGPKDGTGCKPGLTGRLEAYVFSAAGLTLPYPQMVGYSGVMVRAIQREGAIIDAQMPHPTRRKLEEHRQPSPWSLWEPGQPDW